MWTVPKFDTKFSACGGCKTLRYCSKVRRPLDTKINQN
jgi:hypothetical protein